MKDLICDIEFDNLDTNPYFATTEKLLSFVGPVFATINPDNINFMDNIFEIT